MVSRGEMSSSRLPVEIILNVALPIVVIGLGVAGFLALKAFYKPVPRQPPEPSRPLVQTVPVVRHSGGLELVADGVVVPYREIQIAAEVDGRIVEKTPQCEAGTFVQKGTLLLRIDKSDYEIELSRSKEQLRQAEAALVEWAVEVQSTQRLLEIAQQQLEIQKRDYARMEKLFGSNAITQAEYDAARRNLLLAEQEVLNLENQLRIQEASQEKLKSLRDQAAIQLKKAETELSRTEIRAPADGVVISDLVEQDTFVRKGTIVVLFEDTSSAQVKCHLTMRQVAWLWALLEGRPMESEGSGGDAYRVPKLPVTVEYSLESETYLWEGILDGYEGLGVDERTRMVPCRVLVSQPTAVRAAGSQGGGADTNWRAGRQPPALVRGMYVSVRIHVNPKMPVLRIPERAFQPGNVVGRVRDGKLRMVPVELAQVTGTGALVVAPPEILREGDRVAVSPTPFVENNPLAYSNEGLPVEEQPVL